MQTRDRHRRIVERDALALAGPSGPTGPTGPTCAAERVLRLRVIGCGLVGAAIAALPLFGPHRLWLGAAVVAVMTAVNLLLLSRARRGHPPNVWMAVSDIAVTLVVVAVVPSSLAVAAIVFGSVSALSVFWFGPRAALALAAVMEIGLVVLGVIHHPPLWVPAVAALAVCTIVSTFVLQSIAEGAADSRLRFDELVNGIDAVLWEAGGEGSVDFVTANVTDVLGLDATDLADAEFIERRVHPHDAELWAHARARNAEGHHTEVHLRVRDHKDVYRRVMERVKVSLNPDGTVHRHRGVLVDETSRWDGEADLRRYADFIQGIPIALIILRLADTDDPRSFEVTAMNPAARQLFATPERLPEGHRLADVVDIGDEWMGRLAGVVMVNKPYEHPFLSIPGAEGTFALRAVPLPDQSVGLSLEDVTKRERLAESFRHQALHDPLTGLPNRSNLHARLTSALAETARTGNPVALLVVDLDQFKEVNDALGHEYGDRLLAELARRLGSKLRQCDTVARLGGDEFAVLITDEADHDGAVDTARRLIALCDKPFRIGDFRFQVSASVGIALAPEHGTDAETLLRRADGAMYRAKATGRGVAVHSPGHDLYNVRRLELLGDLRDAVGSDDLAVQYQPRIDLRSHRTIGVEALVRWHHPRHGVLPPDEFIELAEVSGTIHRLTQNVSERASAEMRQLQRTHDLAVSINLSTRNLYDPRIVEWVSEMLARHDIVPGTLYFEITESQLMGDPSQSLSVLNELRSLGVRFSIDDFGTGYSSLSYLRELPIDEVKIDRSFVADVVQDDTIVRSVIDLGHNLGLHVVAEGVEDHATMERLRVLGCDSAQGYHFGAPMDADVLTDYLEGAWEPVVTLR